ncbi:MAG: RecX family transcriptional regulator [Candidatus Saccharibacteria bacterium]
MKITAISLQIRDKNRVSVSVDGKYRFSLDLSQVISLGLKNAQDYTDEELLAFEAESQLGKLYGRALEYCLMRPHSAKEVRDYLYRKTRPSRSKTGELKPGVSPDLTVRVYDKLVEKRYIDDQKFANYWIENRSLTKGASRRKLTAELRSKGVEASIIEQILGSTERNDSLEIQKIIAKKRSKYPDDQKLMMYLARQGFNYDDIKSALGV